MNFKTLTLAVISALILGIIVVSVAMAFIFGEGEDENV